LVVEGDHESSVLWDKVAENGAYGGVMPTAGKMGDANIKIIEDWIDEGAACDSNGGGDTGDTGGSEGSAYTLERVQDEVLDSLCKGCHSGASPGGELDLSDLASASDVTAIDTLVGVPLVVAGDPDASYLYMKMRGTHDPDATGERGDAMPPPAQGDPPEAGGVDDTDALTLTYGWILEGAQQ
jgi:hypothetical protein